jgi:amino acid adenylation domain-containing protein
VEEIFVFPTSYSQQRLWFIDQLEPNNPAYHIFDVINFTGALDVDALRRSLEEMARRHESLRTTFSSNDGQPVQVVSPPSRSFSLSRVDLSRFSETERQAELQRLSTEEASGAFDLERGPLWRTMLARLSGEEHVLLLTMHHIISDAWSMQLLTGELETLYEAYRQGEESPLEELPIQYADFAVWQREWLQGDELERQLKYWRERLAGAPEVLELPTDKPRPSVLSPSGANQPLSISKRLTERLKLLSQGEGATLFMTLLAAFKTLLHCYAGQDDIVVGSPVANRGRQELESLIGFFTNTLALRTDMSGDPSFRELLGRVKEICLGAYAHQDLPFEKLVEELEPERSLSHAPLVQVMFQLLNNSAAALEETTAQSLAAEESAHDEMGFESATVISEIGIDLFESDGGLAGRIEYSTDLFEHESVRRMMRHWLTLLEAIAEDPERRLSELPLMSEAERRRLLFDWNSTAREYSAQQCLHQLFEAQAERDPLAIAVVFEGEQLSYGELNLRANKLARFLRRLGVGPEVSVAFCFERCVEALVAVLGILKAGGVCVGVDPEYPEERVAFMLGDSATQLILTQQKFSSRLPESSVRVVCVDAEWERIAREPRENLESEADAENAAFVIYTSGSTGRSKGVTLNHRGLANRILWGQEAQPLGVDDCVLQHFSYCFDFAVWEIFTALIAGARLALARPGGQQDAAYLASLIAEQRVTVAGFVPSMLDLLLDEPGIARCDSLRRIFCGGEALTVELQERCLSRLGAELQNTYGPTEASIDVTFWVCGREGEQRDEQRSEGRKTVPIGEPIANTQLYLLDRRSQPVPVGVPGELHIGGHSLARGYLNHPALTAEKFIPNPFSAEAGARLYKTGDLARYLSSGAIEFIGRLDQQLKIRGFRVEPGEIEAALAHHPSVREALVMARDRAPDGKQLVAYLVANPDGAALNGELQGELRRFLKERLPDYMIPSAFVRLEAWPLLPNGKVDRRALPDPLEERFGAEAMYVAPQTELERTIAGIWQELFGLELISVESNFFELGGHSLIMVRVHSRLREALSREVPLIDLFRYPTIGSLAKFLGGEQGGDDGSSSQQINERAGRQRAAANRQKQAMGWRAKVNG